MKNIFKNLLEQVVKPDEETTQTPPVDAPPPADVPPPGTDPNTTPTEDPNMMGGGDMPPDSGMDPEMGGGIPGEETLSPLDIGRAYELKKIHKRLTSLESYLSTIADIELIKLRNVVLEALELFQIIISNFNSYKDTIDEVIVMFYQFTDECYLVFKNYLKEKVKEKEKNNTSNVNKKEEQNKKDNSKEF